MSLNGKILAENNVSLGVVIQARMGSTRLLGKVLKKLGDKTLLEYILFRLKALKHKAIVIVATSDLLIDDFIKDMCIKNGIDCFRGSEDNVLERYYLCAKQYFLTHIVRLTADNPFTDIEELDKLITLHLNSDADYTDSFGSLPIGVGAEIFTFASLEKTYLEGKQPHHIEHVDEYIIENPHIFKCSVLGCAPEKSKHYVRLTVDTVDDYDKACYIIKNSGGEYISTVMAIELSEKYAKSLIK